MINQEHIHAVTNGLNGAAVATSIGTMMGYGPAIAGYATALWLLLQAYFLIKKEMNKKRGHARRSTDR